MKLTLSLLKHSNPRAFEIQARQVGFKPEDIEAASLFRVWQMEEFPSKTYEILNGAHRVVAVKVKFKAEDFVPAMRRIGEHYNKRQPK